MGLLGDSYSLYIREMLIFKKNLRTSIARSVIFPIVLIILLGNLGTTVTNLPIAVVNYDHSIKSISFINMLESGNMLKVVASTTQQNAMSMLQNGQVAVVVVIPPGFSSSKGSPNVIAYVDSSSPFSSVSAISAINAVAEKFGATVVKSPVPVQESFEVLTNYTYGASSSYKTFLVAGVVMMVAAFGSMWSGGFTLLTDRQLGNLKTFLVTPINKLAILISKIMSGVTQAVISGIVALAIGMLDGATFATSLIVSIPSIIFFMFLAALGFSGIATMLASRINKVEVYSLLGMTITMPLWFLSGAFLPTSTLPSWLYPVSVVNPLTYAVNGVRDIMLKGVITPSAFMLDTAVLVAFILASIALSFIMFKSKIG